MSCFHIVVAKGLGVVFHVVDHVGSHVGRLGVYIVEIVARGLSLQDIAIVNEDDVVTIFFTQTFHVSAHTCQCAALGLTVDEVVREE